MKKFVFIYSPGKVPKDKMEQNGKDWYTWLPTFKQKSGLRVASGSVVSSSGVKAFAGDIGGVSILEAESMEEAQKIAKGCPSLPYGGDVTVLEEFVMVI